jgi:hypothetical protein
LVALSGRRDSTTWTRSPMGLVGLVVGVSVDERRTIFL